MNYFIDLMLDEDTKNIIFWNYLEGYQDNDYSNKEAPLLRIIKDTP